MRIRTDPAPLFSFKTFFGNRERLFLPHMVSYGQNSLDAAITPPLYAMQDSENNLIRVARDAMRTRFEIALPDSRHSEEYRRLAGEEALKCISHMDVRV